MPARYVIDTSSWEPWQRDYRFGVILVMPPHDVAASIDALRQTYDPKSHAILSAHISVSDPLPRGLEHDDRERLQEVLRGVEPFEVRYSMPMASAQRPGVACPVEPQERFDELKRVVHHASLFGDAVYARRDIPAHMTVAEFVTIGESLRIATGLADKPLSGSFWCDRLEYIVPDQAFRFHRRDTFLLGAHRGSQPLDSREQGA
jgi:hypothetical protein